MNTLRYIRGRWPEAEIPTGEPEWLYYEIDDQGDAVLREVLIFPGGRITRNSIEIETRSGKVCPSLIHCSVEEGFRDANTEQIGFDEFETVWSRGVDTPFWNID